MSSMRWPYTRSVVVPHAPRLRIAFDRQLPGLRRHQVRVAGVGLVVVEVHRGEEVVEVQLAHAAFQLEVAVEVRRLLPGQGHQALRPAERARQAAGADLLEPRVLAAEVHLQLQVGRERAAVAGHHLVAIFLHRRRAAGQRHDDEVVVAVRQRQRRRAFELVERVLARHLQSPPKPFQRYSLRAMRSVSLPMRRKRAPSVGVTSSR